MEKVSGSKVVCVTGGSGYIASWLVKKLLEKGHTVHVTLRNLQDKSKVGLLKSFPNAETKLVVFKADIYSPEEFEHAIAGCDYVFHVATALQHTTGFQYKNMVEATVDAARSIAKFCVESGKVRRLIFTGSVVAASPFKDDGSCGFKEILDESCWTPLDHSFPYSNDFLQLYTESKTLAEKEILSYGEKSNTHGSLEVVSLVCGLVGGDTLSTSTPVSTIVTLSQFTDRINEYNSLKFLEQLNGKVLLVHIEDVCEAHIFCMEQPSLNGRFICASSYVSIKEIGDYYKQHYPKLQVKQGNLDHEAMSKRDIKLSSSKIVEMGFKYKYDAEKILDDCFKCANRMGDL